MKKILLFIKIFAPYSYSVIIKRMKFNTIK